MKGSIAAIVTPMKLNGGVDFDSFKNLLLFHEESETDGLVLVGTTGESATLKKEERNEIFSFCSAETSLPLMAGVGSSSTLESIELIELALNHNIIDCLAVTPYYNKPSQKGLELHFNALCETQAKITLYNVPGRTGVDLMPQTISKLAENKNITGIKEAVNTTQRFMELKKVKQDREDFILLSGDDLTFVNFMRHDGDGIISVAANVMPREMKYLSDLCLSHKFDEAEALQKRYSNLFELLFIEASPSPCKYLLEKMSLLENNLRLPLHPLSEEYREKIYEVYKNI